MFRSKVRTILTILAIFIGAFTLTLTNGIGAGISNYIERQIGNLGQKDVISITLKPADALPDNNAPDKYDPTRQSDASSGGFSDVLREKDIESIKTISSLSEVEPTYTVAPDYISAANNEKYKIISSFLGGLTKLDLAAGNQLNAATENNELVLLEDYVSVLGFSNANDAIGKKTIIAITDAFGTQNTVTANIVGVQRNGLVGSSGTAFNTALIANLYALQTNGLPEASKNKYGAATAKINGEITDEKITEVKKQLDSLGYSGSTTEDALGAFNAVIDTLTLVLNAFAVITLLAASFGIVNTLLMSVQERTKEIGLMKAMGMPSSRVFLLFSAEAVLIGFWGSLLGVLSAVGLAQIVNKVLASQFLADLPGLNVLEFSLMSVLGVIGLIMVIAFISGTLPANKAAKQNPIDALRYE